MNVSASASVRPDRERQHEVRHGQQPRLLGCRPFHLLTSPAFGTGTMVATVVNKVRLIDAVLAVMELPSKLRSATRQQRPGRAVMRAVEHMTMAGRKGRPVRRQDGSKLHKWNGRELATCRHTRVPYCRRAGYCHGRDDLSVESA